MNVTNFYAGPAILAPEVLIEARNAVENFENMGLSILEISHRSKQFIAVLDEAQARVKSLLNIGDDYAVLFLTGGASTQFFMTAMNLLDTDDKAGYLDTGEWSSKAIKEAKTLANIEVVASSKDKGYTYIPKGYEIKSDFKYLHLTSNNTIYGTQIHHYPETNVPFVCDMSSDIFSRPIDMTRFSLIYAGSQKNLGPAGTTLVIVRKDILGKVNRQLPTMLQYQIHVDKDSSYNTPPVFPIYVSLLSLRWLENNGGLEAMERKNNEKSKLLYDEIDRNSLFRGLVVKEDRSHMNVCFTAIDDEHTKPFLERCAQAQCVGVAGYRTVGGFRASIYNAMPLEGVQKLVDVMKNFEKENA